QHGLVDIESAEVGKPGLGEHGVTVLCCPDNSHVERPRTEIVQRQRLPRGELLAGERSEVRCRRHGFGYQHHGITQSGLTCSDREHVPADRAPLRRMCQPHLIRMLPTELPGRLVPNPPQYRGERLAHRNNIVTEQQVLFVHPLLGCRLEARGLQSRLPLRVPADYQEPTLLAELRWRPTLTTVH